MWKTTIKNLSELCMKTKASWIEEDFANQTYTPGSCCVLANDSGNRGQWHQGQSLIILELLSTSPDLICYTSRKWMENGRAETGKLDKSDQRDPVTSRRAGQPGGSKFLDLFLMIINAKFWSWSPPHKVMAGRMEEWGDKIFYFFL